MVLRACWERFGREKAGPSAARVPAPSVLRFVFKGPEMAQTWGTPSVRGEACEKQIPFGNDNKKSKSKSKACEKQIPFGNDNKKSKSNRDLGTLVS
jgi:hypothetical protein